MNDDVLIVGSLKDDDLRRSINELVDYVSDKTQVMANKFESSMNLMKDAMKDFAISQKVSVQLMQQAWREMSSSFDAMVAAQQSATTNGNSGGSSGTGGTGGTTYNANTIGALEKEISLLEKERKEMELGTDELQKQNRIIEARKNILKREKENNTFGKESKQATKDLGDAMSMSSATLELAKRKLIYLESVQKTYANSTLLSVKQQNRLADAIERTTQKIQKFRSSGVTSSNQPTSFFDIKNLMPEESVDDIVKKMSALKKVKTQDAYEAKLLGDEYQRLKRKQADLLGMNIQHTKSNNYLAQSFGYIRNRIVYALTLGAIMNFTKQIYEIRSQYELLERSLGVLVNSFERGTQVFLELNQMALESPFTLMELAGAAKQLTAYNFAAKEVVDTTRRLADISAALGVPMERLTYNLGQIRAQTVLTARDARDFANAGLPVVASLAEHFSQLEGKIVTTGDVYARMSKKMVSYSDVMAVLNSMTDEGGKFFDFQAKQAETLRVQLANLTLAWNNMLNEMGTVNQGLLTFPVGVLKSLLKNWQAIDRVIKSILLSFGLVKIAQIIAIRYQWAWAAAASATAKQMGFVANMVTRAVASMRALFANPWTWVLVGVFALVDLVQGLNNARIATKELNDEIRNNANEAGENMLKFLNNKGSKATLELAKAGKLTAEEGDKAWTAIREQIETSAMSCEGLIAELLELDDINERVAKGFDYSERIQKAQAALQDLGDTDIKVTSDLGWFGVFGEGLVSDLKDYADDILEFEGTYKELQDLLYTDKGTNTDIKIHFKEFQKELDETAESINNFIVANHITDPLQINEILERVRAQIKVKNPDIKGEAAKLFDLELDKKMAVLTNNAVDSNSTLWKIFMDRLKRQSSATFTDINDEWVKSGKALSKEQQEAVDENLQYFKDSMPYAYEAVAQMVADASKLKIHIGITFGGANLTDFQKEVNKRIEQANNQTPLDFGSAALLPTPNDNLSSWVKTQRQAIKKLGEDNKNYQKDNTEWSKQKIKDNDREIQQRKNLLDLFHQQYAEEKKSRGGGSKKDVVLDVLKQEIDLVKKLQSDYDKLTKAGASSAEAFATINESYGNTIKLLNSKLATLGIPQIKMSLFEGKDPNKIEQFFKSVRDALTQKGLSNLERMKAVEAVVEEFTISAKTYNLDKITKGLNSELDKLKDEYELAVELDANPELGDLFTDMFKIDTSDFPRTISEYMQRVQNTFDAARKEFGYMGASLNVFQADEKTWKQWGEWVGLSGDALDKFKAKFVNAQGVAKKWAQGMIKETQDLQYKLTDTNGKIAIETKKLAQLEEDALNAKTDDEKKLANLRIKNQKNVIAELQAGLLQEIPEYAAVFDSIAEHSDYMTRRLIANLKKIYDEAKARGADGNGFYTIIGAGGEQTRINKKQFEKEYEKLTKEERKAQAPFSKLREAFTKGEDGVVDYAKGLELVGTELNKVQDIVSTFGSFAQALGADRETVEIINDIATSIGGVATMAQGIGQIADGDYIGGIASVASGLFTTLSSWFDNADNKIVEEIEESERAVKRLENSYKNLEVAIEHAYGVAKYGAEQAAIANQKLQLVELKRQLYLERSRDSKHRDEDRIIALRGEIIDLENEIKQGIEDITNDLLGITSVGSAAEELVNSMITAFKQGEDYMAAYEESFEKMVDNIIMKAIVSRVVGEKIQEMWDMVDQSVKDRGSAQQQRIDSISEKMAQNEKTIEELEMQMEHGWATFLYEDSLKKAYAYREELNRQMAQAQEEYNKAITPTPNDVDSIRDLAQAWKGEVKEEFEAWMGAFGVGFGEGAEKQLSGLQAGIQGVTEDTAGAIEAYLNGMSQQAYLRNDLLVEIRDAVIGFDMDVQVATMSQMLLQLQQSYAVQLALQEILTGVLNPSGRAFMVELNS